MRIAEVVGQPSVARLIARLIARSRLPHASMVEGVPGCGRRTVARAIAQALLCARPIDGDACGTCPACALCAAGTHPDLVSTPHDSESEDIPVDLLRDDIVARAYESPLMGERRVFILYSVERLQNAAANVLLKVLEEPPAGAYFIATTAQASAVLKTIRSRAQLYRLQPLAASDVAVVLGRAGIPTAEAHARSERSAGGHRGLWGDISPVPLEDLRALSRDGLRSEIVARVIDALPTSVTAEQEAAGRTVSAEQRRVLRQWLVALAHDFQRELRQDPSLALALRMERLANLHHDIARNLSPRLIIEALALDQERRRA
ncbi:MAG: DNA polymerase III subunit [Planctomycetes bacterium]|nr:DNA polymerase III subunit [Planctomycetota bacterium]